MTDPIPSFQKPPLNEVFLSVQFEELKKFDITSYGKVWQRYKDRFPVVEQYMPVMEQFEKIGGRRSPPELSFSMENTAPMPRAWFITEDSCELIQIQPNRFFRNWRRNNPEETYPRYDHIREAFVSDFKVFESFVTEMETLKPNQCEISYINHIEIGNHKDLEDIFIGWSEGYDVKDLADVEDIRCSVRHIIKDNNGKFLGRLYISIQPAFRQENKPIYVVELTVRGMPLGEGAKGVMEFMDMGREKIVRTFAKITKTEMHLEWAREI